jgi:hypothetical protein
MKIITQRDIPDKGSGTVFHHVPTILRKQTENAIFIHTIYIETIFSNIAASYPVNREKHFQCSEI